MIRARAGSRWAAGWRRAGREATSSMGAGAGTTLKSHIGNCVSLGLAAWMLTSCAAKPRATPAPASPDSPSARSSAPTTQPILYHRTGGIAGTDDRVVIWPDGVVEVDGRLMTDAKARVTPQRMEHLVGMF